ncbi:hypothetical protein chiPu_0016606 [Chiloscyllium punctatum]|uniref:Uncharacterized protein n=1 Tax=Chiloscyllium punctatum TaxID=137246 RepID=A0A401T641_CHIPU|nr:hypothetical protein [Chiloscyllium punctatum]
MPEPSTVCKDYTDEQMANYFVPKGRPLRDKLPPPKPSPVKKKEDDQLYDPFPPARSPPTPKPWPSVWSYRDTPMPIVLPIPEGLPTPLQPRKYRKPIKRAVPRPVRTPKKPPGLLSHPLPEPLPCPMNAQRSQRLAFDFTPFQTPETVHALWNKLDQQTQALEKRRKEIIELKTLRNQYEVLLVQQQTKIQKLLEGIKCPTTSPEEKAELAKELQLLEKLHIEAKHQLLEVLAILLKIAEQQQKQWVEQKKQEEQCGKLQKLKCL